MSGRKSFLSQPWRVIRWAGLVAAVPAVWACTSRSLEAPTVTPTQVFVNTVTQKINNNLDILFMVDNSSSMDSMQQKLYAQLPTFMGVLEGLPMGLPSVHVAVVSSDMGAQSDTANIGCGGANGGEDGAFQNTAEDQGTFATCASTTLAAGAEYISDDATGMTKNFTAGDISTVFQCIALLGSAGCGFEHQLASIDHALGSDNYDGNGVPQPPATNVGFLRDGAYLGIVMLTNEDDCSAPPNTTIYSENGQGDRLSNPDGPLGNYRCNGGPHGGHLCQDPNSGNPTAYNTPPIMQPADVMAGTPPTLPLANCKDNDSGSSALIPVSTFVKDIQGLKPDPANQILVAAVTGVDSTAHTPTPYAVEWTSQQNDQGAMELWPSVAHNCISTNGDGSFADPAVRIAQFVNAFGSNGILYSICDNSYANALQAIATKLGQLIKPKCVNGTIQTNANGNPNCTVTNNITNMGVTRNVVIPDCAENGGAAPCWNLTLAPNPLPDGTANNCDAGTQALSLVQDMASMNADSLNSTIECSLCVPGMAGPGC
jgi:hypothetical protein